MVVRGDLGVATVNIKSIEYSKNPVSLSEAFLIKVYVTRTYEETIKCSSDTTCGQYTCGQQIIKEEVLTP